MPVTSGGSLLARARAADERGQTSFEFMIVLPFIFLFVYLMVEGAIMLEQWTVLDNAVREGARYGAVGHTTADIQDCTAYWSGGILSSSNVSVVDDAKIPGTVTVGVKNFTYNLTSGLRGLTTSISLSAKTSASLEATSSSSNGNGKTCS